MSKFLIPLNNTPWGVITNPVAPDTYEHVLSFDNETVKTKFIGKELFNDESFDYKLAIEKYDSSFTLTNDGLDGIISIDLNYLNSRLESLQYTLTDLMNIDSIFIKEDGKINLYAVTSATRTNNQNNVTIDYTVSLDVMFNSIDELELSGQVEIKRAHTDRHNGSNYLLKDNTIYEDDFAGNEPVVLENNHVLIAKNNSDPEPASYVSGITWAIIYSRLNEGEEGVISESFYDENDVEQFTRLPYKIFLIPLKHELDSQETPGTFYYVNPDENEDDLILSTLTYEKFVNAPTTISIQFTKDVPLPLDKVENINGWYITITDARVSYFAEGTCLELKDLRISYSSLRFNDINLTSPEITTFNENRNIKNEAKLQFSQFRKLKFISRDKDGDIIIRERLQTEDNQENIISNKIYLGYIFGFQSEVLSSLIYVENELLDDNLTNKKGLLKIINNEIPTSTDAYLQYLSTHRIQSKTGYLSGIVSKTLLGTIGGITGGKPFAGALTGFTSGIIDSAKFAVQMNDLKNTPDTPKEVSSVYGLNYKIDGRNYIFEYRLPENYLKIAYDFLYSLGYKINKIAYVQDYLKTRYYFNYIQTDNIFSLIKNRYSPARKQIINDTFKKGFTIWNVRDINTFKGICNYKYENQEMSLISLNKKGEKNEKN